MELVPLKMISMQLFVSAAAVTGKLNVRNSHSEDVSLDLTSAARTYLSALAATKVASTLAGNVALANPVAPKDGDVKTVNGTVFIRVAGVWQTVFPSTFS